MVVYAVKIDGVEFLCVNTSKIVVLCSYSAKVFFFQ